MVLHRHMYNAYNKNNSLLWLYTHCLVWRSHLEAQCLQQEQFLSLLQLVLSFSYTLHVHIIIYHICRQSTQQLLYHTSRLVDILCIFTQQDTNIVYLHAAGYRYCVSSCIIQQQLHLDTLQLTDSYHHVFESL